MATQLSEKSLRRAIEHVCLYGDTDVFPYICELHFLRDKKEEIVAVLSKFDIDQHQPPQALEALTPKSRYGFRIAHQLHFLETVLFTASVIEIGAELEALKSEGKMGPFAYRFADDSEPSLFQKEHTFRDWLRHQHEIAESENFIAVIFTDIADFYSRIYLHRIEGVLEVATSNKGVKRFIEKTIKNIRSRQSYGIPVGGSASRTLAEAVIAESDSALLDEGIAFTRFVDDFRIFVRSDQHAYEILSFLAEQLFLTEGLTLNGQKTFVKSKEDYIDHLLEELPELSGESDLSLEALAHDIYFSEEEPTEELLNQLRSVNLIGRLEEALSEENWEFGKIKAILRALRITKSPDAAGFCADRFDELLPFAKELLLLFDEIHLAKLDLPPDLTTKVIKAAKNPAATKVPTIQAWLLEFFVRRIAVTTHGQLQGIDSSNPLIDRQISLIRGLNGDANFFRRNKTRFDSLGPFSKYAFIMGATCLPKDEFDAWIGAVRPRMNGPLDALFCDWAKSNVGKLPKMMAARIQDVNE